ncbi:hypothetical protein FRB91_006015 [Serendipita sp. 411]|nr:hypothetical protein FRC18_000952 [Serendipita sp. 400]KAG8859892.1 hypothetical protein FRB91_006015 [Serendipita sp. 411]
MSSHKVPMTYVRLGKSGLKVSRIILGCMSYGKKYWYDWVLDEEEGIKHIKEAFALGINTFDTANVYSFGESEKILGKAVKEIGAPRSSFVIMTKLNGTVLPEDAPMDAKTGTVNPEEYGYINYGGLCRKHIFESVKASLERLQMDYIDVLQCHRFDPNTPIEETMRALHDVVQAGYVRYIGMSSCYAWQFHIMQNYAINNNLTPFISMQNFHSLIYREEEREMTPLCEHLGVGTIPWSPLSRGLLSRPRKDKESTHRGKADPWNSILHPAEDRNLLIIDRVEEIANKKGVSMSQVALAWLMQKSPVAAPIVGTTSLEHLRDMIKAINVKLDEEEVKYLEELYTSRTIVGH